MDLHLPSRLSLKLSDAFTAPRDPIIAYRFGRGRSGGSTWLDTVIQLSLAAGRTPLVGDGDRRNPTLSALYPPGGVISVLPPPASDEIPDTKDFLTACLAEAISRRQSLLVDLGGGDRAMQEYGRDLGLVELCEAYGFEPVGFFSCGPEADDFDHIVAIWQAGFFRPRRSILVFNEHLVPQGRTSVGAFDRLVARPEMKDLVAAGMMPMFMPRLPCMVEVRRAGFSLLDAATGGIGPDDKPFDPVRQFMVRQYLTRVLAELGRIGALSWLP